MSMTIGRFIALSRRRSSGGGAEILTAERLAECGAQRDAGDWERRAGPAGLRAEALRLEEANQTTSAALGAQPAPIRVR
jgi:hypothetical protein